MVTMTTAESSVAGHFSATEKCRVLTLLIPVNTSVSVNFGVTHPHDHLS